MIENIDLSDINDTRREWIITSYAGMNKDLRMIFIEDLPIKRLIICYENNKYYYLILDNNDLFISLNLDRIRGIYLVDNKEIKWRLKFDEYILNIDVILHEMNLIDFYIKRMGYINIISV